MENQLIQLYVLVCHIYNTHSATCFQRMSNNRKPDFTDQELITVYLFGHIQGRFEKKAIHRFIDNYWRHFFPRLPSYQTFVSRLNKMEQTFQTIGRYLNEQLKERRIAEVDHLVDSLPVMLARQSNAYVAKVARDVADFGYCAAKKTYFHGVRLHTIAQHRSGTIPLPRHIWLREASCHDLPALKEQDICLQNSSLIGDKAFPDPVLEAMLKEKQTTLYTPLKKPRGAKLTYIQKYYNKLVSKVRQPIESFFNWLIDKTDIQRASKVRSTDGLMIHCFGKLTVAYSLLVFNY